MKRPELAGFRGRALDLIDLGDFDQARSDLRRGRERARLSREGAKSGEAELLADEAGIRPPAVRLSCGGHEIR